jgi:hypothetical protein
VVKQSANFGYGGSSGATQFTSGTTITVPETGLYALSCHFRFGSGTAYAARLFIYADSVLVAESEVQAGASTTRDTITAQTFVYLSANDTVVFRASTTASSKSILTTTTPARASVIYLGDIT